MTSLDELLCAEKLAKLAEYNTGESRSKFRAAKCKIHIKVKFFRFGLKLISRRNHYSKNIDFITLSVYSNASL